ncbi:5-bromo-4-chloroindolyl phosphate hydrolysis family protein [Tissierella sp.]|uniref:5-bromo-4-chloroindolyl phosphate hydrolysis family protein n=1 Tax=Tissierella sp. TaxID=41274 RepID=UPI00285B4AF8|nr:5-bromo-4-chloroindolyl phosphate hydrolysis family protein [Tissierella sp.]MDR7855704.1 5-bromo-4-chloroindolyl phosphate hydrolysis family protein [Tissierella sp.]
MNRRGNLNLGNQIKDIVQDALNNGDFKTLNREIESVVKGALDEVGRSINRKQVNNHNLSNGNNQINSKNTIINYSNVPQGNIQRKPVPKLTKFTVPMGQVSSVLLTVFGIIGSTAFGIAVFVLLILGSVMGGIFNTIAMGLLPCFIGSVILSMNGSRIRKRLKRFQRYVSKMNGRNYALIKDLSSVAGWNDKATVKDLQKMISIGMFPEGHIDDKKTCFMLNNECYEQYLELQEGMKMKELEKQESQKQDAIQGENNKDDKLKPEIRKAIDEGRQFVTEIKNANIAIPGEEISLKLDRLEEITGKIYDYVEIHPEKFNEIKKFTEYFLPTTLKLVDAYRKFDHQPVQGENISSAKKEIEETMDTINIAFENLLDGLFEDAAMDISTDISVLETMFAQEGLTEKNMRVQK